VKFSVSSPAQGPALDLTDLHLRGRGGESLLANGDFAGGLDRWFFSADDFLPWHISSVPVAVLFDQGWLGLAAFAALGVLVFVRGLRYAWQGDRMSAAMLGATLGLAIVGMVNSLTDSPRCLLMLMLLPLLCCNSWRGADSAASGRA